MRNGFHNDTVLNLWGKSIVFIIINFAFVATEVNKNLIVEYFEMKLTLLQSP